MILIGILAETSIWIEIQVVYQTIPTSIVSNIAAL